MNSNLNLFFDTSAEISFGREGLYLLGTGILRMFQKPAMGHSG